MSIKKVFVVSAETKKAQKEVEELTETLEILDNNILEITDNLKEQQRLLKNTAKTDIKTRKNLIEQIEKTKKRLEEEKIVRANANKEKKKANKELKESIKNQKDLTGVLGFVDKATGGALSAMQGFVQSITGATKGMKLFRLALIASGIGLLVAAITGIIAAFKRSEEGQEKFQIALAAIGAVTNQVMDAFASLGELIIDVFTKPQEVFKSFSDGFMKFISDPIGTVKGAFNDAKEAVTEFIEETKTEISAMTEITKARQKAHHIDRALKVERAEADRKINDIRLQAEDRINNTATERIALLRKAQSLEEDITAKEIESQRIKIKAQEDEMALGKSTIADKDKLAEMQAKLIQLDTKKLRSQRLLQTQITTALNEEKAEKQRKIDEKNAELELEKETEQKRLDDIKAIRDAHEQKVKEEQAVKEEEKAVLDKEKALLALEELNATEEEKANIIAYWDGKIQEGKDVDADNEKKRDEAVKNAKLGIAKNTMALIGMIAGEGSRIGKAMAIGQATINGYQGVQNAFTAANANIAATAAFPAYPFIQASLAGAFAAANIAKIASTSPSGSSGTSGLKSQAAAPQAQAPSFNIVGQGGTNQIASALGDQQQTPVQAYVVSQDITTAQSLENGIIQGATLGG